MSVKLLTEHHLELQSLKGGCRGSSESTLVKMPHCWKSRETAQLQLLWESSYGVHKKTYGNRGYCETSRILKSANWDFRSEAVINRFCAKSLKY